MSSTKQHFSNSKGSIASGSGAYVQKSSSQPQNDFYNIANLTRFGPATVPSYVMVPDKVYSCKGYTPIPGPGAYYPEHHAALGTRSPAFSLGGRLQPPPDVKAELPAPNQYQPDYCKSADHIKVETGRTFGIRWNEKHKTDTSDVPYYSLTNLNAVRMRYPTFKMAKPVANGPSDKPTTPGPSDYFPEPVRDTRAFSFGTRYSNAVSTLRTDCEYQLV